MLWKVTVVARHRARSDTSHRGEDALVSFLYTRTKPSASRWAALETIVVVSRYDRGNDWYWDDERSVEETREFKAPSRPRKWKGWPAQLVGGRWRDRKGHFIKGGEREARRRNRISLTRRKRRKARAIAEKGVPEASKRELDIFFREFTPYETRDAFARVEEPPAYRSRPEDEDVIERLHEEYDELEAGGGPGGR